MKTSIWIILTVVVIGGGTYWWIQHSQSVQPATYQEQTNTIPPTPQATTTTTQKTTPAQVQTSFSGAKTYASTQYGVSLQYPNTVQTNSSPNYTPSYSSPDWWWYPFSNNATNLFSVTSQGDVVLLAVSNNGTDVAKCGDTSLGKTTSIGGVSFQVVRGTDGSNNGASFVIYRTVHNNLCYAIARTINLGWRNQQATKANSQLLDLIAQSLRFTN